MESLELAAEAVEKVGVAANKTSESVKTFSYKHRRGVINDHHRMVREAGFNPKKRMNITTPAVMKARC